MSSAETTHRSYLFAPASKPEVMRKAIAAGADAVVLDLEDSVAPDQKAAARANLAALLDDLASTGTAPPAAIHVRINRTTSGYDTQDLDAAARSPVEAVRLPKAEDPAAVRSVSSALATFETERGLQPGSIAIYPTVESASGVLSAQQLAECDPRIARLVLGQADLVADLGARGDDALTTLVPRALLALASRAAGIGAPVDGATTDLVDPSVLDSALHRARALGFFGKSAIHPRQIAAIHEVFTPDEEELAAAERIVRAAEASGGQATSVDGELVDVAIVRRAQRLLELRRDR